jgi:tRNA nucleotidyltransferase (CCA-adding enzyme)
VSCIILLKHLNPPFLSSSALIPDQSTAKATPFVFGTPLEDALARDFTINSLYFNIHTAKVEDFSGMGIPDLIQGFIRAPVSAECSITADPLRVIRAIRFAARLQFRIDEDIIKVSTRPSTIHTLGEASIYA